MNLKIRRKLESDKLLHMDVRYSYEGKVFNLGEIFDWAIHGKMGAITTLSRLYFNGELISADKGFAIKMLENLIARQPSVPNGVHLNLGAYYSKIESYDKAIALYCKLEELKYAPAIIRLAMHYNKGIGVDVNLNISKQKLVLASGLGHIGAKNLLAMHYIKHESLYQKIKGIIMLFINVPRKIYLLTFKRDDEDQLL